MLHVYTINGEELANVDTSVGRADRIQQILCVAFSQAIDWDPHNVIITGSSDGVVRVCIYNENDLDYILKMIVFNRCGPWNMCKFLKFH